MTGAYRSVEMVTNAPWFAGGVLRSVHRYASDAMVVTMVIHMLRYFAFDRLRGFRWFSWVTGVVLIWLVYVAGVNGYMLPWDQLAQFVITASFEWLDWLPSFGGALMRNFIYPASVSDRFFSLLVFIHIGVPLLTLLLMWVHVQRVPKASTQPPRPIAISVSVTLIVLSLVLPVASQGGPAQLDVSPTSLQLDWFLLPLLPLIDAWPLGYGVGADGRRDRAAAGAAVAALAARRREGRSAAPDRASRRGAGAGAQRRDAARSRAARRPAAALRLPRRRLRPVPVHGAQRPRRTGCLPAGGADRGDARARAGADVLRRAAGRPGNRGRVAGARGAATWCASWSAASCASSRWPPT